MPVTVTGLTSNVTAVSAGRSHTCAVVDGGGLCWGRNDVGQLGNNSTSQYPVTVPVQVAGLVSGVTSISTGFSHSCAAVNGAAQCWGANYNGNLGDNSTTPSSVPVPATGLSSGVTSVSAG